MQSKNILEEDLKLTEFEYFQR